MKHTPDESCLPAPRSERELWGQTWTLQQISKAAGCSWANLQKIEKAALRKLGKGLLADPVARQCLIDLGYLPPE